MVCCKIFVINKQHVRGFLHQLFHRGIIFGGEKKWQEENARKIIQISMINGGI